MILIEYNCGVLKNNHQIHTILKIHQNVLYLLKYKLMNFLRTDYSNVSLAWKSRTSKVELWKNMHFGYMPYSRNLDSLLLRIWSEFIWILKDISLSTCIRSTLRQWLCRSAWKIWGWQAPCRQATASLRRGSLAAFEHCCAGAFLWQTCSDNRAIQSKHQWDSLTEHLLLWKHLHLPYGKGILGYQALFMCSFRLWKAC